MEEKKSLEKMHEELLRLANKIVSKVQKQTKMYKTERELDRAKSVCYSLLFNQFQGELNLLKSQKFVGNQTKPLMDLMKVFGVGK